MAQITSQRGFFGLGAERISKAMNLGNLMRSAHAFGASFVFTVAASHSMREAARADTSKSPDHVPYYPWEDVEDIVLPKGCQLVGIELVEGAIDLPSFHHPLQAAYVLGPERGSLSPPLLARCDHIIKIPTRFCLNVQIAGSIVMYDRLRSLGSFAPRPPLPGGPMEPFAPDHVHGSPTNRSAKQQAVRDQTPPQNQPKPRSD